jgi:competence protein ComEC
VIELLEGGPASRVQLDPMMKWAAWVVMICGVVACRSSATGPSQQPVQPAEEVAAPGPVEPDKEARVAIESESPRAKGAVETPWMRLHFIEVGQGAATLLEFPCGAALIDAGGEVYDGYDGEQRLLAYLAAFFAERPDLNDTLSSLILTHPHADHVRGAPALLERYRVQNIVTNGMETGSGGPQQAAVHLAAAERDLPLRRISTNELPAQGGLTGEVIDPIRCDDIDPRITILWGQVPEKPADWSRAAFESEHNHSLVVRVDFGEVSFLTTGDLEQAGIGAVLDRHADLLDVDLYQVGHHCSASGTTPALLEAIAPHQAICSNGRHDQPTEKWTAWAYGHPWKGTIELLAASVRDDRGDEVDVQVFEEVEQPVSFDLAKAIYSTAWDGDIVIRAWADGRTRRQPR